MLDREQRVKNIAERVILLIDAVTEPGSAAYYWAAVDAVRGKILDPQDEALDELVSAAEDFRDESIRIAVRITWAAATSQRRSPLKMVK